MNANDKSCFNFGILNKKANILDDLSIGSQITNLLLIRQQLLYKEDSSYGIYETEDVNGNDFKITGRFNSPLTVGKTYEVYGKVAVFREERQINIDIAKQVVPKSERMIIEYLKTLEYMDEELSYRLYQLHGIDTIKMLCIDTEKVVDSLGLPTHVSSSWMNSLNLLKDDRKTIDELVRLGITLKQARQLYEKYGEIILSKIKINPYMLSDEFTNYTFTKCDTVARTIGHNLKSIYRITSLMINCLKEAASNGHCFMDKFELYDYVRCKLEIKISTVEIRKILKSNNEDDIYLYNYGKNQLQVSISSLQSHYNKAIINKITKIYYPVISFSDDELFKGLHLLLQSERIVIDNDKIYLTSIYQSEKCIAERIFNIEMESTKEFQHGQEDLNYICSKNNIILESMQKKAILEFTKGRGGFYVLRGSAGCGKTFTLRLILEVLEMQYKRVGEQCKIKVFAPTGKAAKVAAKATERDCVTVHRGLKFNPSIGFEHGQSFPLSFDCIVVDESSMLDVDLAMHLLLAIENGTKVIFLGDTKQLPSVGPGNILNDIIDSNTVTVITLDVVKRQGKDSGIIKNAQKIINKEMITSYKDTKDAFVIHSNSIIDAQLKVIKSFTDALRCFNYNIEDVQILCPQRTSDVGTEILNYLVQETYNPLIDKNELKVLNKQISVSAADGIKNLNLYYRKGDKVIHTKNNYGMSWYYKGQYWGYQEDLEEVGVMNGEIGIIEEIVEEEYYGNIKLKIIVRYGERYVFYTNNLDELDHAFALTIHKSQGSQWKAVILPIMDQNLSMLDNNLIYTGYTRASELNISIGNSAAILIAIETVKSTNRNTALKEKLRLLLPAKTA